MQFQTGRLLYLVAFVLVFSGCKKKTVHCADSIYEIPFSIAFVGFSPESIDTVIRLNYATGSNFSDLLKTDIFFTPSPVMNKDTFGSTLSGNKYSECKIYLSGETDTFFIKDVKYPVPREWEEAENCLSARASASTPSELKLNNITIHTADYSRVAGFIFLKKN
ncbi:MAG: hypothetical protein JNL13_08645 [Chitinophagaceae bacterium]|nr:hypothetical protein [Chitinophagaceae bacterium]